MSTFVYAPSVEIHIRTVDQKIYDVSDDLVQGSVQRITSMAGAGGVSSIRFTLANSRRKYDGAFSPMDQVIVYMKRIKRMLVFSGYLDVVPAFTVFPGPVDLQASCTMKRLQYWMWDPDTTAAQGLLNDKNEQYKTLPDAGMAKKTIDLLTTVTGWPKDRIHIGKVPDQWFDAVAKMAAAAEAEAEKAQMVAAVGSGSYLNGNSSVGGGGYHYDSQPAGTDLPATSGKISDFGGPNDPTTMNSNMSLTGRPGREAGTYYCAMRWKYVIWNDIPSRVTPGVDVNAAIQWLKNRPILVVNPSNGKAVIVLAVSAGPAEHTGRVLDLDPTSCAYLGGTDTEVNIAWADPSSKPGPVTINKAEASVGGVLGNTTNYASASDLGTGVTWPDIEKIGKTGPPMIATSTTTGGHVSGSYHFVGEAVDFAGPSGGTDTAELLAINHFWAQYQPHLKELIYSGPGNVCIKDGKIVDGASFYSAVWGEHHNHVHVAATPGSLKGLDLNNLPAITTDTASTSSTSTTDTTSTTTPTDPYQALFNVYDWIGFQLTGVGDILGGARALMNDQPISQTVDSLMSAALRVYCSAPNGDFIAWFPDYFGWWKIAAKMVIRDIELLDFSVGWSDASLKTHYYVTSATSGVETANDAGSPYQMVSTAGIATVEMPDLMNVIFGGDIANYPGVPASVVKAMKKDNTAWGQWLLKRFGARPAFEPMQNITGARQEFFFAVFRFMQNWASQYAAQIRTTFLPEVYPGMLVVLPTYGFQAYVTDVTHDFSLTEGGSFGTTINVVAPSSIGRSSIPGLPRGGPL